MAQPKAYSYIRFSSPEQEKGDSLRRQVEQSEEYAQKFGLELDDTLKMTDRGLSAFKGSHKTKGALGKFLQLVEEGEITPGSLLIVENLDRLSREQVLDALNQFTSIIRAGIKLVTLQDGMEYDQESINQNWAQLIISITYMARAHEESERKAYLLSSAWRNKREKATNGDHKLTSRCPDWLRLSEDRKSFHVIPERAKIIRWIYEAKLAGKSVNSMVTELNESASWKPKHGWRKSYIQKILRNRAVIGFMQPHGLVKKGKDENGNDKQIREPIGESIPDYFPAVVDEETFYRVQEKIRENNHRGGKTGKVNNLFAHIAKCAYCHAPMQFVDKGKPGEQYLVCDNARRGVGCIRKSVRYDEFERTVLEFCKGLDASDILPGQEDRKSELTRLRNEISICNEKINELETKAMNLADSIADTSSKSVRQRLENNLQQVEEEKGGIEARKHQLNQDLAKTQDEAENMQIRINNLAELFELMGQVEGRERKDLRLKLREQLRELIDRIDIYPLGRREFDNKEQRVWTIHFSTGDLRVLCPTEPSLVVMDVDKAAEVEVHLDGEGDVDVGSFGDRAQEEAEQRERSNEKVAERMKGRKKRG